jgi:hypothetical protein
LLKVVPLIDQPEIKREIKRLKKYLIDWIQFSLYTL